MSDHLRPCWIELTNVCPNQVWRAVKESKKGRIQKVILLQYHFRDAVRDHLWNICSWVWVSSSLGDRSTHV